MQTELPGRSAHLRDAVPSVEFDMPVDEPVDVPVAVWSWVRTACGPDPVAAAAAADRLTAWADACRLAAISALEASADRSPSELLADGLLSSAELARAERRARAAGSFPGFAAALAAGVVTPAHLDRLADASRRLSPEQVARFASLEAVHLAAATSGSLSAFTRHLQRHAQRIQESTPSPDDPQPAEARLARQRAQVRLTSFTDRDTGMVVYRLVLDPLTATQLDRLVAGRTETLFHTGEHPDGCPSDLLERQQFLQAHALLHLTANPASTGGAEVVVVVDHTTPDGHPDIDWGHPDIQLPTTELHRLLEARTTRVHEVVVRNGVVLTAPGTLALGRTTRLANRAQRRALRALYRTCAVPGCDTRFDHCTIHHVHWWRHGGATDLSNLLPLCTRHHTLVHQQRWVLHLGPHRELTVTTPQGILHATGPPHRWAA